LKGLRKRNWGNLFDPNNLERNPRNWGKRASKGFNCFSKKEKDWNNSPQIGKGLKGPWVKFGSFQTSGPTGFPQEG